MRRCHSLLNCFGRWAGALTVAALLGSGPAVLADQFPPDPVKDLQDTLKASPQELLDRDPALAKRIAALTAEPDKKGLTDDEKRTLLEAGRKAAKKAENDAFDSLLLQKTNAIETLPAMRRALLLQQWQDQIGEPELRAIKYKNRVALLERFRDNLHLALRQGSDSSREAAINLLAEIATAVRNPEAVPNVTDPEIRTGLGRPFAADLIQIIKKGDSPLLRETAARALGLIFPEPQAAADALAGMLSDARLSSRRAAANGLLNMIRVAAHLAPGPGSNRKIEADQGDVIAAGRAVAAGAGRGLADPDPVVRRVSAEVLEQAATTLGELIPHALAPGASDYDRANSAKAQVARKEVAPLAEALRDQAGPLAKALSDQDLEVRLLAQRAFVELFAARQKLERALGKPLSDTPPPVPEPRGDLGQSGGIDRTALQAGSKSDDPLLDALRRALPAVAKDLSDPVDAARQGAVNVLEAMGSYAGPAVPELIKALADKNHFVRWSAARTLGKIGPVPQADAVPGLARLLDDPDLDVNKAAAQALEHYGPVARAAVPNLIAALQASDAEKRLAAIRALEGIGTDSRSAIPALSVAVGDPDKMVRQTAAGALGKFGPAAAAAQPALRQALGDAVAEVRQAASDALLEIRGGNKPK